MERKISQKKIKNKIKMRNEKNNLNNKKLKSSKYKIEIKKIK